MDLHFASSCSPFSYLISEHARAVVAIQELQREVNSLLCFRDHVLEALPHLQLRGEAPPRRPTSGGKSLSEGGPSTVVDSGFSTDKASTSMGKSSSTSSGELSGGGTRWTSVEPPEGGGAPLTINAALAEGGGPPLGSAEDELWQLLEVIQKKGTKLRRDLEKAEVSEREYGHSSDPTIRNVSTTSTPRAATTGTNNDQHFAGPSSTAEGPERWKLPNDWYPHSLPGTGPKFDLVPGLEAWGEMERLRQDRLYLMGRLSRAETEAASTHQRLIDLHSQLLSLAGEKRRLEDAFRTLKISDIHSSEINNKVGSPGVIVKSGMSRIASNSSGVTVSVKGEDPSTSYRRSSFSGRDDPKKSSSVRIGEEIFLPRVLKVPIKDKSDSNNITPRGYNISNTSFNKPTRISSAHGSPSKVLSKSTSTVLLPVQEDACSDRIVIERERRANRIDGGLSMPTSLLKGNRIKVQPNKQRISAILREKDVLALQKQLLTTVMETEVLRRQMELSSGEWSSKISEWEVEKKQMTEAQNLLTKENLSLKLKFQKETKDIGVTACPSMQSLSVQTDGDEEKSPPSHSVHNGPNIKYDVVVYQESPNVKKVPSPAPRKAAPPSIEKPPRKTRPPFLSSTGGIHPSFQTASRRDSSETTTFGRDSLGRVAKVPLKSHSYRASGNTSSTHLSTTPVSTPRSSPASSISLSRTSTVGRHQNAIDSSTRSTPTGRYISTRRDSIKASKSNSAVVASNASTVSTLKNGKGSSVSNGGTPHKVRSRGASLIGRWLNILE